MCFRGIAGRTLRTGRRLFHATNDSFGVSAFRASQLFDGRLHSSKRMRRQQLQHANVMTHSGASPVAFFQTLSEQ